MKPAWVLMLGTVLFFSCAEEDPREKSTIEMADTLRQIAQNANPKQYPYLNSRIAREIGALINGIPYDRPTDLRLDYARNLIYAGQIAEGVAELEKTIQARFPEGKITPLNKVWFETLAIGYLRLGEQENCIINHTSQSCLMPIQGEGIHQITRGSENAIRYFLKLLEYDPDDLQSRWLINIAYMTLDQYPNQVPDEYLIPDSLFRSEYPLARFHDRAIMLGVDETALAGGSIIEDFNNDGYPDIFATSWGLMDQARLWLSDQQGGFTDHTRASGIEGIISGLNTLQADYDNDGLIDILILRGGWLGRNGQQPNSLLRNLGNGRFQDVTRDAGIWSANPTQVAVWTDVNLDGNIDLFIGNEWYPSELFINQGDGTFSEEAADHGLNVEVLIKGAAAGDVNNDGWPDIYLATLTGENKLMLNEAGVFRDIATEAGVTEPNFSFPTWFWDYDQDGLDDIFVSGFKISSSGGSLIEMFKTVTTDVAADYLGMEHTGELPRLYRNKGDNTFEDVTVEVGLDEVLYSMGANFGDLDNDGYPDMYIGTGAPDFTSQIPNRMFRNNNGQNFQDVTTAGGFGQIQKGHAVSWGDLDNDGDQDIYTTIGGAVEGDVYGNMLLENPGSENRWIVLDLVGKSANRSAIGARVQVEVRTPDDSLKRFYYTVNSGGSFGANSLQLEIGLGQAREITNVTVQWPSLKDRIQELGNLDLDHHYQVHQGGEVMRLDRPAFKLMGSATGGHAHH